MLNEICNLPNEIVGEIMSYTFPNVKEQHKSVVRQINYNFNEFNLILNHLDKAKLCYDINKYFSKIHTKKIVSYMQIDKKNNSKKINLILLRKIGVVNFKKSFSGKKIKSFINQRLLN